MGTRYVRYDTALRSTECRKYAKSKMVYNNFNTFNNVATLQSVCDPTSNDFECTFLGVKTDEGYSFEKWEEWKKKGEI